jgi:fructokinase
VGAGDAFTAALVTHRLAGASLAVQSEAANRWGAWVASQAGAMPALDEETYARIERTIKSAA